MPSLPRFQKFIQLAVVVRQGTEKIVDVQDGIPGGFVAAALAVEICKSAEIRVGIGLFQRFGQRRRAQGRHTAGVGGGKVRRDIERLEVLAQKVQAERINGADGGALQQHPLAAQGRVAGFGLTAAEQRLPDAGPQLGCGSLSASMGHSGSVMSRTARSVSTAVLPLPAAALTSSAPPRSSMAACWAAVHLVSLTAVPPFLLPAGSQGLQRAWPGHPVPARRCRSRGSR